MSVPLKMDSESLGVPLSLNLIQFYYIFMLVYLLLSVANVV